MKNGDKTSGVFVFNETIIGASHIKHEQPCQDASLSSWNHQNYRKVDEQYGVIAVADGHGSRDYFRSDRGSRMACEAAYEAVNLLLLNNKNGLNHRKGIKQLIDSHDIYMERLKASIITRWRDAIAADYNKEPFTTKELVSLSDKGRAKLDEDSENYVRAYGTTLIVLVKHAHFWFGLQIGDGKCVACSEGMPTEQPIPWDDRCFLNVTTSLCDEDAHESFRHCFRTDAFPDAIYIATDGVDDSFGDDERLYDFYEKLTQSFQTKGQEITLKDLSTFLPELSLKGSGDDISVAGIVKGSFKIKD